MANRLWTLAAIAAIVAGCNDEGAPEDVPSDSGVFSAEGWTLETPDSAAGAGVYNSLAFDPSGNPGVSYLSGDVLKMARRQGSAWTILTVD
jgi:hypothetical protein